VRLSDNEDIQQITRAIYERGGIVSSVCQGYCGRLNTRLSDGPPAGRWKRLTGFSWRKKCSSA
jgi:putative intracellular protease/amidase